jgi:hypothetical protein
MTAIDYEIFDDLLIGNFMKTTLHKMGSLYDGDSLSRSPNSATTAA